MGPHKMSLFLIKQEFHPEIVPGDTLCKYPVGITREQELSLEKHSVWEARLGCQTGPLAQNFFERIPGLTWLGPSTQDTASWRDTLVSLWFLRQVFLCKSVK